MTLPANLTTILKALLPAWVRWILVACAMVATGSYAVGTAIAARAEDARVAKALADENKATLDEIKVAVKDNTEHRIADKATDQAILDSLHRLEDKVDRILESR